MKHLPIIAKFLIILGIFGVFGVGGAVYTTGQVRDIVSGYQHVIRKTEAAAGLITQASQEMSGVQADIGILLVAITPEDNKAAATRLAADRSAFDTNMASAARLLPMRAAEILELKKQGDDLIDSSCSATISDASVATTTYQDLAAQQEFLASCMPLFPPMAAGMTAERAKVQIESSAASTALDQSSSTAILLTFLIIIGGLAQAVVASFFAINAWVINPLKKLQSAMERLAGGNLQVNVEGGDRKDEVGSMARTVQIFKDSALQKINLEEKAKEASEKAERERATAEQAKAAFIGQQKFVVDSLASGLDRLAQGQLQFRLTANFASEYEKLRGDFNNAMEKLQQTLGSISRNTHG
ncbi:methyl-accepting chemotaxis protein, partial [Acidocella aquatica]|uniref:methyl-accepting chemotaxis protein n=1 Tax=Acidocella aquatica TaxID=1922313 RepID=UPI0024E097AA